MHNMACKDISSQHNNPKIFDESCLRTDAYPIILAL